jgi:(2Fe-2S) ferredoxin/ubiquinone/menaquinone biosynthesis C-methylase UbiE
MTHPFQHHVFICTQQQLDDKDYCTDQGAEEVLLELKRQVAKHDLEKSVEVTSSGCLGLCNRGPTMVVYPDGIWYAGVEVGDVEEIVDSHFAQGVPVERLQITSGDRIRQEVMQEKGRNRAREAAHHEAGVLSEKLRRLAGDFQASRAFLSAVELDMFTAVGDGATAHGISERMGADPRATEMLLNALVATGLLRKQDDDTYINAPDTNRFLRRGLPDDSRAALMNRVNMWDAWSTLTECIREGRTQGYDVKSRPSATQAYIAATHRIAMLAAPALVNSLDIPRVERILDVGGGSGAYTVAVLRAYQEAKAEILDLPPVIRLTGRYIREAGLEERITLRAGDFMVDPLGRDFDLVLLSYVLHLNTPKAIRRLLAKSFAALQPGGYVVINDYVLNTDKTLPRAAAIYALNMLVTTQGGSVYSFDEYKSWLEDAGFSKVEKVSLLGPTDVISAQRPPA